MSKLAEEIEQLRDDLELMTLRAQQAERERDEISDSLAVMDEKWRHAYNRLRDYEDRLRS